MSFTGVDGENVWIIENPLIGGQKVDFLDTGGGDKDAVGRIAMEIAGQLVAFACHVVREFQGFELKTLSGGFQPMGQGGMQDKVLSGNQPGNFQG